MLPFPNGTDTSTILDSPRLEADTVGARLADPALQEALDRIATCAAVTLHAPLAAVALAEPDRVSLAGRHGFERRMTPRQDSFCAEVVRLGAKLLVADATLDARFASHEYVTQGQVMAYAGAPVGTGPVIGAVEVFSGARDAFRPAVLDDLEALAHMVDLLLNRAAPSTLDLPRIRTQGWIGVRTLDARRSQSASRAGLVILSVARRSPAEAAGLRVADILYAIDDEILRERADLVAALACRETGAAARLTIQRAGTWLECWVKIGRHRTSRA